MEMTFWLPQAEAALAQVEGTVRAYGHAGTVRALRSWETGHEGFP